MESPFGTRTITGGVWLLFQVAALILAALIAVLYWNLQEVREVARSVEHAEIVERELRTLRENMLDAETGQRGYVLTASEDFLAPYQEGHAAARAHLQALRGRVTHPDVAALLARMEPVLEERIALLAQTVALVREGRRDEAVRIVREGEGKRLMDEFRRLSDEAIQRELQLLSLRRASFLGQFNDILVSALIGGVAALLLLGYTAVRTARRVARPVSALLEGIRATAEGDLRHQVQVASRDEIGHIADAFNHMSARLLAAQQARDAVQRELERSNAELDNFAYVASHDLKAPLRGIRNLAEWITEDLGSGAPADTRDNLRLLRTRVDRLDSLLESLLAYSRVGRRNGRAETVDCARLMADISDYLAPRAGFTVSWSNDLPTLVTPRAPLEQVLRNLVSNALKHHDREQGEVRVSARQEGAWVAFRVEDDGPGIAPEFHERIFQMFQTLRPRDQVEGSGMGLAIVRKTVEGFGGRIHVESQPPQRGTAFVFTWPCHWAEPEEA